MRQLLNITNHSISLVFESELAYPEQKERRHMGMPNDLYLVRHGQSEQNEANRQAYLGDTTLWTPEMRGRHGSTWRLTDLGIAQAKAAGLWLRENARHSFDRLLVSSFERARETAAHLELPDAEWYVHMSLRERDWGDMDGASIAERTEKYAEVMKRIQANTFYGRPPNGESMAQLCERIYSQVLGTLNREMDGKRVVIVTHGEVMWGFRFVLERMSIDEWLRIDRSQDPQDKIHNCQILHYTRVDPASGKIAESMNWMRSICPDDTSLSSNDWQPIVRRSFTNDELLADVALAPRLISG